MAERTSKFQDQQTSNLRGLSERLAETNYPPGVFDLLRGLYPARTGLLQRIPAHDYLLDGDGNPIQASGRVLQIHYTGNVNGDVLVQTENGIYVYTLDELFARSATPSITYAPLTEEESMSMALIVQRESNGVPGGSFSGYLTGTDSTSAADTFYGRRLTNMLINESSGGIPTVSSFTASTGGSGTSSTAGSFTLIPGTYRISARLSFGAWNSGTRAFLFGLYNTTTSAFETHNGGAEPILSMIDAKGVESNAVVGFESVVIVASTNKTFELRQKCSNATVAQSLHACGSFAAMSNLNVNGALAGYTYGEVKILKTA